MKGDFSKTLNTLLRYSKKPPLFEPGEARFWDDPHISKGMLEAHLNPTHDAASRRPETIDKEVGNLVSSGILKKGYKVLDLGCGPGLYSSRLASKGMNVTGVDISERSLNYAIAQAKEKKLDIKYRLINFFDLNYPATFNAIIQTEGELNTFSDDRLKVLLNILHRALLPDGLLIFDVTTRKLRLRYGLKTNWYVTDNGFWSPGKHLVLERGFDYPEENVWLDQYIVICNEGVKVYNNWFHDYDLKTIKQVLHDNGFDLIHAWNDLTGTQYHEDGDWIAIVARKRSKP